MTISYTLGSNPIWYFADLTGLPLGGGFMATYSSLDNTLLKLVYEDPAGQFPWPYSNIPNNIGKQGVQFDMNGSQGPFYFQFNSAVQDDLYYIEIYDSSGVLQRTIDNYSPGTGGGGGDVTEAFDINNLIVNNVFWRNTGSSSNPINTTQLLLAPSSHAGLTNDVTNTEGFYTGPDIYFLKNNTSANDLISFPNFPLGSGALSGDITPQWYMHYECDNTPSGETFKVVQFPITQGVQNLSSTQITFNLWAQSLSGANTIRVQVFQFFGDGGSPSTSIITQLDAITLTSSWAQYTFTASIPDVTGKTLGTCGNDGLFLQIQYPLNAACSIDIIKPFILIGNISPHQDYETYDSIDAVINSTRTGYVTTGFAATSIPGFIAMNDGTVGSPSSGATTLASQSAFPLYNLLWNNVDNAWAPVIGGRGSSAVSDFVANKQLQLTATLGRALCSVGTGPGPLGFVLGENYGEQTHTQLISEMPSHNHATSTAAGNFLVDIGTGGSIGVNSGLNAITNPTTANTGGGSPFNVMQPSTFMNFFIKL